MCQICATEAKAKMTRKEIESAIAELIEVVDPDHLMEVLERALENEQTKE